MTDQELTEPVIETTSSSNKIKNAYAKKKAEADAKGEKVIWGKKKYIVKDPITGKYTREINPEEVKKLHAEGYSIREIAKQLQCSTMPIVNILKNG